jgi:hypothetical protein
MQDMHSRVMGKKETPIPPPTLEQLKAEEKRLKDKITMWENAEVTSGPEFSAMDHMNRICYERDRCRSALRMVRNRIYRMERQ